VRRASHAGKWYSSDSKFLSDTLDGFEQNLLNLDTNPRGIIAPHAGFSYSGPTAGYAYNGLRLALEKLWHGTVVVLHPSHHIYLDGCAVSGASLIKTPVGDLEVDNALRSELLNTGEFSVMDQETDENEHSGEMQYPFIAKAFRNSHVDAKVLPIMVGQLSNSKENHFGRILSQFLGRSQIFSVISSDFCHWGKRFQFTPTTPPDHIKAPDYSVNEIYKYIEWMDRQGMDHIASQQPGAFAKYIKLYKNTICGRHPIAVYLSALVENKNAGQEIVEIDFVKYSQSGQVKTGRDSSVSYASAIVRKA